MTYSERALQSEHNARPVNPRSSHSFVLTFCSAFEHTNNNEINSVEINFNIFNGRSIDSTNCNRITNDFDLDDEARSFSSC